MATATLFDTMAQQVAAQCDETRSAAQEQADALLSDARERATSTRTSTLKTLEAEMEAMDARWRQKAHTEAARAALAVQGEIVDAVLAKVEEEIRSIVGSKDFPKILDALLDELMRVASDDVVVLAPEAHLDHVREWLGKHDRIDTRVEASPDTWDGVAIQDARRTYRISNTLTRRYERVKEDARKVCMTTLFPGGNVGDNGNG